MCVNVCVYVCVFMCGYISGGLIFFGMCDLCACVCMCVFSPLCSSSHPLSEMCWPESCRELLIRAEPAASFWVEGGSALCLEPQPPLQCSFPPSLLPFFRSSLHSSITPSLHSSTPSSPHPPLLNLQAVTGQHTHRQREREMEGERGYCSGWRA